MPATQQHRTTVPSYTLTPHDTLSELGTTTQGLTADEAAQRLHTHGPNATPSAPKPGMLAKLLEHLSDVLVIILLGAGILKAIVGDWLDFTIIMIVAVVNVAVGIIQEGRAEKALDSIKNMLALTADVKRNNSWTTVEARELVPGDVVRVRSGDRIPADMRIIESVNLNADESILTGESDAVAKNTQAVAPNAPIGDRTNMLHSGTIITTGTGKAVVTETGPDTEIGRIQTLMADVETLETPLSRQLGKLGKVIAIIVGIMALIMIVIGVFIHKFDFNETVSATIGFAVAAIPEGLPALVTITLAMGVQHMARRKAITRKLTAVEALGSVTTICSDKTGTLTKNEMTARIAVTSTTHYTITGEGYAPHGEIRTEDTPTTYLSNPLLTRMIAGAALCNDAQVVEQDEQWKLVGQPTEGAIRVMATKAGFNLTHERQALVPFESSHKFMATIDTITFPAGSITETDTAHTLLHAVGAPDRLFERATSQYAADGTTIPIDLDYWENIQTELGSKGLRVLAIASRDLNGTPLENSHELAIDDVHDLTLLGLVGIVDPPRPEAVHAIQECQRAGIDVIMITGDHAGTATAIATELGIVKRADDGTITAPNSDSGTAVMTGADVDSLTPEELRTAVRTVRVFARTSPEHKLRIVEALQYNGHVVAMTGDGVNDAPALQRANVGVAMGIKGTEATKEAADVVLADDNFATIETAVEEGRRIFDNIRKSVVFLLPTNGAQSLVILIAVLFGWALPLTPAQILWVNMVTAVTLSLALAYEPGEPGLMTRKPRDPNEGVLSRGALIHVGLVSLLIGGVTLAVVAFETARDTDIHIIHTTAVTTLVLAQLAYLLNCRFLHRSSLTPNVLRGNKMVWIASGALLSLQLIFTLVPAMNTWFGSTPISLDRWMMALVLAIGVFLLVELGKTVQRKVARR
ncbi:cation-translocating P-type ATPase [Timonella sp. A28]|uniref:cation-translocating P-type ATPase n=1 Tax=Timonella sp. A28 TaxID=3442640 RepID=UPI003EBE2926